MTEASANAERAATWLQYAREQLRDQSTDGDITMARLMNSVQSLIAAVKEQAETISRLEHLEHDRDGVYANGCGQCDDAQNVVLADSMQTEAFNQL